MAHESAYRHYLDFLTTNFHNPGQSILDVGGEGGEFEAITKAFGHAYTPINTGEAGSGIRLLPGQEYEWPVKAGQFDAVISSSTFEHIPFFWMTFKEMVRVCKDGGYIYLNAPSSGPNHWDVDCYRFRKDSMRGLAEWGSVELIHAFEDDGPEADPTWKDCVGIFRKI